MTGKEVPHLWVTHTGTTKQDPKRELKKQTERAGGNGAIHEGENVYALKYTCTSMCFLKKKTLNLLFFWCALL